MQVLGRVSGSLCNVTQTRNCTDDIDFTLPRFDVRGPQKGGLVKHFPLKSMILLEREVHPSRRVASGSGGKSGGKLSGKLGEKSGWKKMKAEGVGSCEIRDAFFQAGGGE